MKKISLEVPDEDFEHLEKTFKEINKAIVANNEEKVANLQGELFRYIEHHDLFTDIRPEYVTKKNELILSY